MAQANFSAVDATSTTGMQHSAITSPADRHEPTAEAPMRTCTLQDAARELGYGCVDWFIYAPG